MAIKQRIRHSVTVRQMGLVCCGYTFCRLLQALSPLPVPGKLCACGTVKRAVSDCRKDFAVRAAACVLAERDLCCIPNQVLRRDVMVLADVAATKAGEERFALVDVGASFGIRVADSVVDLQSGPDVGK